MKISKKGISLIKNFEGLRLTAYRDIAGVWTIGYGSTRYVGGETVKSGDELLTESHAEALLNDTLKVFTSVVSRMVKVPLNQNQFDALVSFAYNVGTGALQQSTLLKKLNIQDYFGAADQLLNWNKITDPATSKKVVSKTLADRRLEERNLFLKPVI